jgi:sugar phosphate isomerase/epimerase
MECHEGTLMEDSPHALKLIRAVDRPNLTVNLQIPFEGETGEYSVEQLGPYTTHLHIHNWTSGFGEGELTFLDSGAFDWQPIIDRLVKTYKRHVTLSLEHITHAGNDDPWQTAARDIHALRRLRSSLDLQ